tara:strand:+ start:2338 stop:3021 length:684 start_codon:yes stop_codon:yes gene_type:complete
MKNKLLIALLTTLSLLFGATTVSAQGLSGGISIAYGEAKGSGSENVNGQIESNDANGEAILPALFLEVALDIGPISPSIGIEVVPVAGESDTVENVRVGSVNACSCDDSGTNKASLEFENLTTIYALIPLLDTGAFIKAGHVSMDVIVNDKLDATGGSYSDDTANGWSAAIGFQSDAAMIPFFDFMRLEAGHMSFEEMAQVNKNSSDIKIEMDLEASYAKLSLGKNF